MKHTGLDERLDSIIVRAAIRLQERMRLAYFRGNLVSYLGRISLAEHLDPAVLERGSLLDVQDEAAVLLAQKLRQARKGGYLKDYLKQLNMLELLCKEQERRVKPTNPGGQRRQEHLVSGENQESAESAKGKVLQLSRFKVIK